MKKVCSSKICVAISEAGPLYRNWRGTRLSFPLDRDLIIEVRTVDGPLFMSRSFSRPKPLNDFSSISPESVALVPRFLDSDSALPHSSRVIVRLAVGRSTMRCDE